MIGCFCLWSRLRCRECVQIQRRSRDFPIRIKCYWYFASIVFYHCRRLVIWWNISSDTITGLYKNDIKRAVFEHSVEFAGSFSYCKCFGFFVICKGNIGEFAFFIIVVVALVFIQSKLAVCSCIYTYLCWILAFINILIFRTHRNNGAALNKQWYLT